MKIYTFLKGRQDNKWSSLKSLTFQIEQKKWDGGSVFLFLFVEGKYLFWTNVGQNWQMPFSGKKKAAFCLLSQTN